MTDIRWQAHQHVWKSMSCMLAYGKNYMLGKTEGRRGRGWQRMRWLAGIIDSVDLSLSKLQKIVKDGEAWHAAVHGGLRVRHDSATKQQQWTTNIVNSKTQWKNKYWLYAHQDSLGAQMVKNLPAMRETWVRSLVGKIPWRRKWQPTPVFLPGEFHGWRSLVGYSP